MGYRSTTGIEMGHTSKSGTAMGYRSTNGTAMEYTAKHGITMGYTSYNKIAMCCTLKIQVCASPRLQWKYWWPPLINGEWHSDTLHTFISRRYNSTGLVTLASSLALCQLICLAYCKHWNHVYIPQAAKTPTTSFPQKLPHSNLSRLPPNETNATLWKKLRNTTRCGELTNWHC